MNHSVPMDLFTTLPASWAPWAEHTESLELELMTESGEVVALQGRVTAWPSNRRMFVESLGGCTAAGLDAWGVSEALRCAVRDRLIGSEQIRGAVTDGYTVSGVDVAAKRGGLALAEVRK